jgi:hypothetical protein
MKRYVVYPSGDLKNEFDKKHRITQWSQNDFEAEAMAARILGASDIEYMMIYEGRRFVATIHKPGAKLGFC